MVTQDSIGPKPASQSEESSASPAWDAFAEASQPGWVQRHPLITWGSVLAIGGTIAFFWNDILPKKKAAAPRRENVVVINVPPPPPQLPVGSWMRTVPADVQTNDIARTPEGRLIVLLLDDVMIPADPAFISATKKIGQLAIDRMSRGDRMAVVFTAASGGAQNFTGDRARLTKAIESFKPGHATHMLGWDAASKNLEKPEPNNWEAGVDTDAGYRAGSIRTLEDVARSLAAAPERRKILIFVSTGVMADADSASGVVMARPGLSMMNRDANISLVKRMPALYRLMRETNVTMYTIDPSGLGVMEQYLLRTAQSLPNPVVM